jgi:signal transduction histidine kinase
MRLKIENLFTSGWEFNESEVNIRGKFQMINIAIFMSAISLIFAIFRNILIEQYALVPTEIILIMINLILFFVLRKCRKSFTIVSTIITFQYTFFFLFLIYTNEPSSLKHIWIFTYPIILLYLQSKRDAIYWFIFILILLLIAPLQPFVQVSYSMSQIIYLSFVLVVVAVMVNFYQLKMEDAKELIVKQQRLLQNQAKQAVMGEMISMIAHQWRQPLSTVTLSISNMQIKKLLGEELDNQEIDNTLEEISDTVIYLSNTIDDFQTYFHPNKELTTIPLYNLLQKSVSFALPRLKGTNINISVNIDEKLIVNTYVNELVQVTLNIINNAIDALIVSNSEDKKILISAQERGKQIIICITDNADGISEDDLGHIFDPYFSTKGKNGTGLGLYMSQMLVQKQFNGDIKVNSSKNGTEFYIEIQKEL